MSRLVNNQLFYTKQEQCHANAGTNTFFVARGIIVNDANGRREIKNYTSFPNYEAYAVWIKDIPPKERNFYEQIKTDAPCWEYYDIDDWSDKSITPKQLYNSFLDHRIKWGIDNDVQSDRTKFTVLDSSKYKDGELIKGSLHILSQNVSFPNNYEAHKEFTQEFVKSLPSDFPKLDCSVYSKNRVFRLENNTKCGEYRPLKKPTWLIDTGMFRTPVPYLITVDVNTTNMWNISPEVLAERKRLKEERKQALAKLPKVEGIEGIFFDIVGAIRDGSHPRCDSEITNCLNYKNWFMFACATLSALGPDFLEQQWDTVFHIYRHADDSNSKGQFIQLVKIWQDVIDTTSLLWWAKPLQKFQTEHPKHFKALSSFEYSIPTDPKYSCEAKTLTIKTMEGISYKRLFKDYPHIFVKGNMGSGKTEGLSDVFKKMKNILFISSKRSLAMDFKNKNPEFVLYSDIDGNIDLDVHHKIIVQCDSLNRVMGYPDLVITDEWVDVSSQLRNSKNAKDSISSFKTLFSSSKYTIVMDANLDRIDFFDKLVDMTQALYIINTGKYHTDKTVKIINSKEKLFYDVTHTSTGKMYVCSDSKAFIKRASKIYSERYPERKMLILTSETDEADRRETFDEYDCIFVSPTVTAGVSYCGKVDHVFGYYTKRTIHAQAMTQQMFRCRNWTEATVYMANNMKVTSIPLTDSEIEQYIEDIFSVNMLCLGSGLSFDRLAKTITKNFNYWMMFEELKYKMRSKVLCNYYFKKILSDHGVTVENGEDDDELSHEEKAEVNCMTKEAKLLIEKDKDNLILATSIVVPTPEDQALFKANKFHKLTEPVLENLKMTQTFGMCHPDPEWVETYMGSKSHYRNLDATFNGEDVQTPMDGETYSGTEENKQNMIQRRILAQMMLYHAGFNENGELGNNLLSKRTVDDLDGLEKFVTDNMAEIQTTFRSFKTLDLTKKNAFIRFVNAKLHSVYGIKLKSTQISQDGDRFRVYTISGLDKWYFDGIEGQKPQGYTDLEKPIISIKNNSVLSRTRQ